MRSVSLFATFKTNHWKKASIFFLLYRNYSTQKSPLTVTPLRHSRFSKVNFGAQIDNSDLSKLSDHDFSLIRRALFQHQLLVFPNQQNLTPAHQFQLNRLFDPTATAYGHGSKPVDQNSILSSELIRIPCQPQVQVLGHGRLTNHYSLQDITLTHPNHIGYHLLSLPHTHTLNFTRFYRWHIDAALYEYPPPIVTSLFAVNVPKTLRRQTIRYDDGSGQEIPCVTPGSTAFTSGYTAYDLLNKYDKEFAKHHYIEYPPFPYIWMSRAHSLPNGLGLENEGLELPECNLPPIKPENIQVLPMVWKNRETGRLALQIHPSLARRILRVKPNGETQLVDDNLSRVRERVYRLLRSSISPEYVYIHSWNNNDLVLFHNHSLLHTVTGTFTHDEFRLMHQCNLAASEFPLSTVS